MIKVGPEPATLEGQVVAWAHQMQIAQAHEEEAEACLWWQPLQRRRYLSEAEDRRRWADLVWTAIPRRGDNSNPLTALAKDLVVSAWDRIAAEISTKNSFHPALNADRATAAPAIIKQVAERSLHNDPHWTRTMPTSEVPGLLDIVTTGFVISTLNQAARHLQAIAADPVLLSREGTRDHGRPILVVQHKASGLRAHFRFDSGTDRRFGSVYSKPYSIESIDPANPGESLTWERYVGLGIGTRIYLEGARLSPETRWRSTATSYYAAAVRRKLHTHDPYTWAGECDWCREYNIDWAQATPDAFTRHPITSITPARA